MKYQVMVMPGHVFAQINIHHIIGFGKGDGREHSIGQGTPNLMKLQVCSWPSSYRAMKKVKQPHLGVEPKVHPEISSIYNMFFS